MHITNSVKVAVFAAVLAMAPAAYADDQKSSAHDHAQKPITMAAADSGSKGSQDLHKAMMDGMQDMQSMKMTGNTDQDFASMMIEHHQQAIAMAQVQLKNGKDTEVRKKAQEIIAASERDISDLKKWQGDHHNKSAE